MYIQLTFKKRLGPIKIFLSGEFQRRGISCSQAPRITMVRYCTNIFVRDSLNQQSESIWGWRKNWFVIMIFAKRRFDDTQGLHFNTNAMLVFLFRAITNRIAAAISIKIMNIRSVLSNWYLEFVEWTSVSANQIWNLNFRVGCPDIIPECASHWLYLPVVLFFKQLRVQSYWLIDYVHVY